MNKNSIKPHSCPVDIMLYEAFSEEAALLKQLMPSFIKAEFTPHTIQAVGDRLPSAKVISVRTQSIIPPSWSGSVTGILARSEGFDHLLRYRKATKTKARLGHLSGYCSRAVAEQAVMLMMALLRKLPRQQNQFEVFERDGLTGLEVKGARALVVGVGKIGREIVDIVRGLKMEVAGVDIARKGREKGLEYVSLKAGLAWADVIFCALPLTQKTGGLLNYSLLSGLARKPFLVNIARGELTPAKDLIKLMEQGRLRGLALDVFEDEGILSEAMRTLMHNLSSVSDLHRLMGFENVICTPHNAFNTTEALRAKGHQSIESVKSFVDTGRFLCEIPRR